MRKSCGSSGPCLQRLCAFIGAMNAPNKEYLLGKCTGNTAPGANIVADLLQMIQIKIQDLSIFGHAPESPGRPTSGLLLGLSSSKKPKRTLETLPIAILVNISETGWCIWSCWSHPVLHNQTNDIIV